MASGTYNSSASNSQDTNQWQLNKSLIECNRHMLLNGIATDVTFLVSSNTDTNAEAETFSAHKYMLMSRSPVFYSMFCGDLAERGEITVTDVHPEAFRQMLNYIYTDFVPVGSDDLLVLYASRKYMLPGLTMKCIDQIRTHLYPRNACTMLDKSLLFDEKELTESCMKLIKPNTEASFDSDSFTNIRQYTLGKMLDSDMFTIKEVDVFKACLKWADERCKEKNIEMTGANRRKVLGDCFNKIRYGDIEIGEFATVVSSSEVLTKKEEVGMLRHLANKVANPVPAGFCSDSRFSPNGPFEIITTNEIEEHLFNTDTTISITIECDHDINVLGFVLGTIRPDIVGYDMYDQEVITYTSLSSMTHNGLADDLDFTRGFIDIECMYEETYEQTYESTLQSKFIIKAGETRLRMIYTNYIHPGGVVHVVNNNEMELNDHHIQMKLTSNQKWMPILGLKYKLV